MPNKYVSWVSDDHFRACVSHVCDAYTDLPDPESEKFHRRTIDPFRIVFDIVNSDISVDDWIMSEQIRQAGKTVSNRIGEFHQMLLGGVSGWRDLGVGDNAKVDLIHEENNVYVELKNKYNTTNDSSLDSLRRNLEEIVKRNPEATCYWAYILNTTGRPENRVWHRKRYKSKPNIRRISGKNIYALVTGKENALDEMWLVLPLVISDVLCMKNSFPSEVMKTLQLFFERAFRE